MRPDPERLDIGHDDPPRLWERPGARSIGGVVMTGVMLAAVGVGTADLLTRHDNAAESGSPVPSQPVPPDDLMSRRVQDLNGFRQVGFGSVTLIVPGYWGRNEITDCGFPYADTVMYPSGPRPTRACDSVLSSRHSYVAFDAVHCPNTARLHRDEDLSRRLGQPARTSGPHRRHDVYEMQVELASPSCIEISSPYRAVVERLVGTLRPSHAG